MESKSLRVSSVSLVLVLMLIAACGPAQSPPVTDRSRVTPAATRSSAGADATAAPTARAAVPAEKPAKVTLALDWTPNPNHTGIYVAQQKGWYRDQGIDLQVLPYSDSATPELLVANGKADVAISFVESLVLARAAGQDLVSIAAVIPHNTSALVTLKKSGIDSPKKLDGKRYAGFGSAFEQPVISDIIRCDGGKGQFKNLTTNLFGYEALKSGKADFVWIYMGVEGVQARRDALDLNVFYINKHCVPDYPSPVIATSSSKIQQDPEVLRRFMTATARGYEWAAKRPAEAAKLLMQGAPKGTFQDPGFVRESQEWVSPKYRDGRNLWGMQSLKAWTDYPRYMFKTGRVTDASGKPTKQEPDYKTYFTNELLPGK